MNGDDDKTAKDASRDAVRECHALLYTLQRPIYGRRSLSSVVAHYTQCRSVDTLQTSHWMKRSLNDWPGEIGKSDHDLKSQSWAVVMQSRSLADRRRCCWFFALYFFSIHPKKCTKLAASLRRSFWQRSRSMGANRRSRESANQARSQWMWTV